jgi:enoyl-CoA hydratase/carnithine racemase
MTPDSPSTELIHTAQAGAALIVTLNNPARRNSIDIEMRHLIIDAVERAATNEDCRAIVLTGAQGHFSAGGDLSAKYESGRLNRERMHGMNDTIRAIARSPKPVIAAVEGAAYGVGLSLAAVCDLIVASATARFCAPFTGMGLTADGGLHHTLPRRIGFARARRMILTGDVVGVELSAQWGLVDVHVEQDALATALELADALSRRAPLAIAASKEILARTGQSLDEVLDAELAAQVALLDSEDFHEGKDSFLNKRKPTFMGR